MIYPKEDTQASRILRMLLKANGGWVAGQTFRPYYSQYHARIKELEDRFGWPIEHSDFTDEYGFKSYRIRTQVALPI